MNKDRQIEKKRKNVGTVKPYEDYFFLDFFYRTDRRTDKSYKINIAFKPIFSEGICSNLM